MSKSNNRLFLPISIAIMLIIPMPLLYYHGRVANRHSQMAMKLVALSAPGQTIVSDVIGTAASLWNSYVYLVETEKQNQQMRNERKELLNIVRTNSQALQDNARLQRLLEFKEGQADISTISARIISRDTSPFFRVLRLVLDVGEKDSVKKGMPVLTHQGLVGKVQRVSDQFCDVMLITDSRSSLGAMVAGKSISGTLNGNGDDVSYLATFQYPFQKADIETDDLLITTGHEQIFPKGIVLGRIASAKPRISQKQQELLVVPAVDLSNLEEVLIVTNYRRQVVDPWQEADDTKNH